MKTYSLYINNYWISFPIFLVSVFSIASLGRYLPSFGTTGNIVFGLIIPLISGFVAHLLSQSKIEIQLSDEGIKHKRKQQLFFRKKQGFQIKWDNITTYYTFDDLLYQWLGIELASGIRYKITRIKPFWIFKDDYDQFISDFEELAMQRSYRSQTKIVKAADPYISIVLKGALISALIILGIIILFNLI